MSGVKPRLICFPHSGASSMTYYSWRAALADHYEVCIVDPPGRVGRPDESPATTMAELLSWIEPRIESMLQGRYVLYGHSLGALVAFEVARRLPPGAAAPALLVVSGRNGPAVPPAATQIHKLPDSELVGAVDRMDRSMPALSDNAELAGLFLPILRADLQIAETYQYRDGRPLSCPILSIQGNEDPLVTTTGVATWAAQTTSRCTVHWMPGEHLFHLKGGAGFLARLPGLISTASGLA